MSRLALTSLVLSIALAGAARAEDLECRNGGFPAEQDRFGLAKVTGPERLRFLSDMNGCPSAAPACVQPGYVVAGDILLTGRTHGDYVCAFYPNRVGGSAGWVRRDRLSSVPVDAAPPPKAWAGRWANGDDNLRITPQGGELAVKGEAYWPSANPPLAQFPGGPNVGELEGRARPKGQRLVIADGAPDGCGATLTLTGPFLVVADNGNCGGMNVRFNGAYRRR